MAAFGKLKKHQVVIDPGSVGAASTLDLTVNVLGILEGVDRFVGCEIPPTLDVGLGIVGGYINNDDKIVLRFMNATAGGIDPGSATYFITTVRGDDGSGDVTVGSGPDWAG